MPVRTQAVIESDSATRLRIVIGRLAREMRSTAAGSALTPTQYSVLGSVVRRGPLQLAELGRIEGLNPTMLSRAVHNLSAAGLVDRQRDDRDGRAIWVQATTAGQKLQRRIRAERSRALDAHLAGLSRQQRTALEAALPALEALAASVGEARQ